MAAAGSGRRRKAMEGVVHAGETNMGWWSNGCGHGTPSVGRIKCNSIVGCIVQMSSSCARRKSPCPDGSARCALFQAAEKKTAAPEEPMQKLDAEDEVSSGGKAEASSPPVEEKDGKYGQAQFLLDDIARKEWWSYASRFAIQQHSIALLFVQLQAEPVNLKCFSGSGKAPCIVRPHAAYIPCLHGYEETALLLVVTANMDSSSLDGENKNNNLVGSKITWLISVLYILGEHYEFYFP
ncbi:hypothetical protein CFC21_016714 [Triticum aestivum]|uniref:Uncharacterized protein n=2 Tax=Triticum aestivum TaxID=4565 RepID=A0A9R1J1M7_WHEAT|nr:hypothetical protein CFC21_016714 [Triticum aestivum]